MSEPASGLEFAALAAIAAQGPLVVAVLCGQELRWVSPAVQATWGWTPQQLAGAPVAPLVHPQDQRRLAEVLDRPDQTPQVLFRLLTADGTWRTVQAVLLDRRDDPAVAGVVVQLWDVARLLAWSDPGTLLLHDALTGLANRTLLLDRIELALARSARHGRRVALLFVDLDEFKPVNDRYGHLVGDRLLASVGGRLRTASRPSDTACRWGGDEFAVLCEGIAHEQEAREIGERLLAALVAPVVLDDGVQVQPRASVGIALSDPPNEAGADGARDSVRLIGRADRAMYVAKREGGGRVHLDDRGTTNG